MRLFSATEFEDERKQESEALTKKIAELKTAINDKTLLLNKTKDLLAAERNYLNAELDKEREAFLDKRTGMENELLSLEQKLKAKRESLEEKSWDKKHEDILLKEKIVYLMNEDYDLKEANLRKQKETLLERMREIAKKEQQLNQDIAAIREREGKVTEKENRVSEEIAKMIERQGLLEKTQEGLDEKFRAKELDIGQREYALQIITEAQIKKEQALRDEQKHLESQSLNLRLAYDEARKKGII